jgi:hypothetical protein
VQSVSRDGDAVRSRLADGWIELAGGSAEAPLADLASGRRFSVQFWDPNATKALHVAAAIARTGGNED